MIVLGIDPGASGAVAVVDSAMRTVHWWFDMQLETREDGKRRVAAGSCSRLMRGLHMRPPELVVIEEVHAMPKQGVTSSFHFGRALGLVEEAAAALGAPVLRVPPRVWKKAMGLPADKAASRALAAKLFPAHADAFKRAKDDGRAEAVLLAEYGARRSKMMGLL